MCKSVALFSFTVHLCFEGRCERTAKIFCTLVTLQKKHDWTLEICLRLIYLIFPLWFCSLHFFRVWYYPYHYFYYLHILSLFHILSTLFSHPVLFSVCNIFHHLTAFQPFFYLFCFLSFLLLFCRKETIKEMQVKIYWCIHVGVCKIIFNKIVICRNKISQLQFKSQPVQYCNSNIYSKLMNDYSVYSPCICLASKCYRIHSVSLNEKWII